MSEEKKRVDVELDAREIVNLLETGKEGVLKFNAMREEDPEWSPNLSDWELHGLDLTGINFSGAILHGCAICDTNLTNANLSEAELCGADLSSANLSGANLIQADLSNVNLRGAILNGANLYMVKGLRKLDWQAFNRILKASIEFAD